MKILIFILVSCLAGSTLAHRPLITPQLAPCQTRASDFEHQGHRYAFSWLETSETFDWLDARNYCRQRCMDAVAIDTQLEWNQLLGTIQRTAKSQGVEQMWTSGRLCDFEGCESKTFLQPIHIKGWFWSAANKKTSDTNCTNGRRGCFHGWSDTGKRGMPQPDNREPREENVDGNESCMALISNRLFSRANDELAWHDKACYHKMHVVCEDSDKLLRYARRKWRGFSIP